MILESLLELVETLTERIDEHGVQLRQSEWHTRYALIDPLLRELGWDTEDPSLVIPEYQSGHGRADYALLGDGKPLMMVEAKKLGTQLSNYLSQGIQYCLEEGTAYFSITDGQHWKVYETHKPVPIGEKLIVGIDLKNASAAEACLKALALWRPSVQSGHVAAGEESVVRLPEGISELQYPATAEAPAVQTEHVVLPRQTNVRPSGPISVPQRPVAAKPPAVSYGSEWHPLSQVSDAESRQPVELLFPDGSIERSMKTRIDLPIAVIRWLINQGLLGMHRCPVKLKSSRAFRYIVHSSPVHSTGSAFDSPEEISGLYFEKNIGNQGPFRTTIAIIEHVGQDPAQFSVRFP